MKFIVVTALGFLFDLLMTWWAMLAFHIIHQWNPEIPAFSFWTTFWFLFIFGCFAGAAAFSQKISSDE